MTNNFQPMVSIIMPAFNAESTVALSITSIIEQTYSNWELIIIDDKSTDQTVYLIEEFNDPRIVLYKHRKNIGVSSARNFGLTLAKGKYIAFLDSDDLWTSAKLELQVLFSARTNSTITYCRYTKVNKSKSEFELVNPKSKVNYSDMLFKNHIGLSTGMFLKAAYPLAKFDNVKHEDYIFWASLLKDGSIARLVDSKIPLVIYCENKNSLSGNKLRSAIWHWKNLRVYFCLSFPIACYYFLYYSVDNIFRITKKRNIL
jgi:glycosyltransferase involved in cell wall biosynthesis